MFEPIPRKEGVSDRVVRVALFGRFTDEFFSGLPEVLMPTIKSTLGLTNTQVGLLWTVLGYVAAFVEPTAGLLNDIWQRKWIFAFGVLVSSLSIFTIGLAATTPILVLGFALYGVGTGPMAHSADIILVETHPENEDRIFARSTMLDTIGAGLAPALVAVAIWLHLDWRWTMFLAAAAGLCYAILITTTKFPPLEEKDDDEPGLIESLRGNVKQVISNRKTLLWLLVLFGLELFEAPFQFRSIWLAEEVGMTQAQVALYKGFELVVGFFSLILLERIRQRLSANQVLTTAVLATLFFYPLWLIIPGIWAKIVLTIPFSLAFHMIWVVSKPLSLASVPGKAGTITALTSLYSFVPMTLLFGMVADAVPMTFAMLAVAIAGSLLMLVAVRLIVIESD